MERAAELPPIAIAPSIGEPCPDAARLPLCVDLDGTLLAIDTLPEAAATACLHDPRVLLALPRWLAQGKARLKHELARRWDFDPALLPYNFFVLDYLQAQKSRGRKLVLATAADRQIAQKIADHLGLFDAVIASDGTHNLKGEAKAAALVERFGARGFVYAGNAHSDLAVWREAAAAVIVNAPDRVRQAAASLGPVEAAIECATPRWRGIIRALRPYQWVKNLLVFVPLVCVAAYRDLGGWEAALASFAAFSAVASAIYLLNDICDLAADRAHPSKARRPFASGAVPIALGLALAPLLFVIGGAFGWLSGAPRALVAYAALSLGYNIKLKEMPLVDIFVLAALYSVRLFGGGEASGYPVSLWLLGFSSFTFLSLALIKRVSELLRVAEQQRQRPARRGYMTQDIVMLEMMGCAACFTSALVLTLYVQSDTASHAYLHPKMLWGIVPLMLFWQCRLWLSTARGYMLDDPIIYTARDWVSWLVLAGLGALIALAYAPVMV
ncbi:MAG TPA: UbiA family prenyltransferase [Stellaceae bacterium]|nr:UbiA family prenyltransferase [Stellaceae bacterium]